MLDPYPRRALLSQKELMAMLSMDRSTWYEFRADPTAGFPAPVQVGRGKNGKPRLRWRKWQVIAWLEGLRPADPEPDTPPDGPSGTGPEGPRKKS